MSSTEEHRDRTLPDSDVHVGQIDEARTVHITLTGVHHFGANGVATAREVELTYRCPELTVDGQWRFDQALIRGHMVETGSRAHRKVLPHNLVDGDPDGTHGHPQVHSAPGWLFTLIERFTPKAFATITTERT